MKGWLAHFDWSIETVVAFYRHFPGAAPLCISESCCISPDPAGEVLVFAAPAEQLLYKIELPVLTSAAC